MPIDIRKPESTKYKKLFSPKSKLMNSGNIVSNFIDKTPIKNAINKKIR